jgi:hypothetical protein
LAIADIVEIISDLIALSAVGQIGTHQTIGNNAQLAIKIGQINEVVICRVAIGTSQTSRQIVRVIQVTNLTGSKITT